MLSTIKDFSTYFVPLIEARRVEPRNDLVSAMVAAIDNESLSTVETLMVAITIKVAGNETTTNLIGNTVVELLANPDQLKLLLDDLRPQTSVSLNLALPFTSGHMSQLGYRVVVPREAVGGTPAVYADLVITHTMAMLSTITTVEALTAEWHRKAL